MPASAAPMVRVERGGIEEAIQLGHLVVADAEGKIATSLGDAQRVTYYRSCAKPFQAIAGIRTGIIERFGLTPEDVAIMAASHNGEARHIEAVRDLLRRSGISENELQCGAHWPTYEPAASEARRRIKEPLVIFNNCSGKHAGMLAASKVIDAPLDTYLDRDHPIQQRIAGAVAEFTGVAQSDIRWGLDGCSAPNAAVPLVAMARSFAGLLHSGDEATRTVVTAMTTHPFLIAGTDRFDTRLMEVTHGRLLAKGGAAGAHCTADRRSGLGLAVKLDSGDGTWIPVAVMAALEQLGWLEPDERQALAGFAEPELRNHRRTVVGSVRPLLQLN